MGCPEQEHHLNFEGEGALHKAFQAIKIISKASILFPCKTKLTKLHCNCSAQRIPSGTFSAHTGLSLQLFPRWMSHG